MTTDGRIPNLADMENILHHINYRWNLGALAMWKGEKAPFEIHSIYEGYDRFISLETVAAINRLEDAISRNRLKHALIDHYLRRLLLPHENEMRTWMKGAAAHVEGEKIYFRDIIPWCQKFSTYEKRRILQKETRPLCLFLKPFVRNYWEILLDTLKEELGYDNYIAYCREKKGIDYHEYYEDLKRVLEETRDLYFSAMENWVRRQCSVPLTALTRFDAINLLSLSHLDTLFPEKSLEELTAFFECWGINLGETPGLTLELGAEETKSAQAMCFILQAPEEVYILMKPEGGWTDLETLWHELGHGLSAVFTSPDLSVVERDMATSFSLSESFAFLLQNITLSLPFLRRCLKIEPGDAETLYYYKVLKDLSLFRRYAAKFLAEYDMFASGDLSGGDHYAELMAKHTGFYYQPESHLFDLVPEFYSLDYVLGWMAEAAMESFLKKRLGDDWIFHAETGEILREWWKQGNAHDLDQFMKQNDLGSIGPEALLRRWRRVLARR